VEGRAVHPQFSKQRVLRQGMNNMNFADGLPARLNVDETAKLLGVAEHDVATLVAARLLTPLGCPAKNAPKFFAKITVLDHCSDVKWLDRATRCLGRYWKMKRERRKSPAIGGETSNETLQ
jgi:hypothetical protein